MSDKKKINWREVDKFLTENYGKMKTKEMAIALNIPANRIHKRVNFLGLASDKKAQELKVKKPRGDGVLIKTGILKIENGITRHRMY